MFPSFNITLQTFSCMHSKLNENVTSQIHVGNVDGHEFVTKVHNLPVPAFKIFQILRTLDDACERAFFIEKIEKIGT